MSTEVGLVQIVLPCTGLSESWYSAIPALSLEASQASDTFEAVTPVTRRLPGVDGAIRSASVTTVSWLLKALFPRASTATTHT